MDDYKDFIIAENEAEESAEEVANPQTEEAETIEVQEETKTEPVKEQPKEQTETQRVAQRIKEATEKARQEARDTFIAEQGYVWNGKPITTEADYKQAMEEQRQAEEKQRLMEEEKLPEAIAEKMVKVDKYLNKAEAQEKAEKDAIAKQQQEEERQRADIERFVSKFQDVDLNTLDKSVWEDVASGMTLVEAYSLYKINQLESKTKIQEQNKQNKQKAPIGQGVTTHGSEEVASEDDFMRGFNSVK